MLLAEDPTAIAFSCAIPSYNSLYKWENPVRGAGVSVSNFTLGLEQLSFDFDGDKRKKQDLLDTTVDKIRAKYGNTSLQRARILQDEKLAHTDIKGEHIISAKD